MSASQAMLMIIRQTNKTLVPASLCIVGWSNFSDLLFSVSMADGYAHFSWNYPWLITFCDLQVSRKIVCKRTHGGLTPPNPSFPL